MLFISVRNYTRAEGRFIKVLEVGDLADYWEEF